MVSPTRRFTSPPGASSWSTIPSELVTIRSPGRSGRSATTRRRLARMGDLHRWVSARGRAITGGHRLVIGAALTGAGMIARGPVAASNLGDAMLLGAVIILGHDVFVPAFRYLRFRTISIELLVSIAIVG